MEDKTTRELAAKAAEDAAYTRRFIEMGAMLWVTGIMMRWGWSAMLWVVHFTSNNL